MLCVVGYCLYPGIFKTVDRASLYSFFADGRQNWVVTYLPHLAQVMVFLAQPISNAPMKKIKMSKSAFHVNIALPSEFQTRWFYCSRDQHLSPSLMLLWMDWILRVLQWRYYCIPVRYIAFVSPHPWRVAKAGVKPWKDCCSPLISVVPFQLFFGRRRPCLVRQETYIGQ